MSTKTTFKRVAAVAAAALAIGGLSAVSAHAADITVNDFSAATTNASSFTVGTYKSIQVSGADADAYYTITNSGTGSVNYPATAPGSTTLNASSSNVEIWSKGSGAIGVGGTGAWANSLTVSVYSATAGTQTITIKGDSTAKTQTYVLTWGAAPIFSATNSSSYIDSADTTTVAAASFTPATADATIVTAKTTARVGTIYVSLANNVGTGAAITTGYVTAVVTGSGLVSGNASQNANISATGTRAATSYPSTAGSSRTAGLAVFGVFGDNTSGTGTITITYTDALGVSYPVATETVIFSGTTPASIVATQTKFVAAAGTQLGTGSATLGSGAFTVSALDSNGNPVAGLTTIGSSVSAGWYLVSDNVACITNTLDAVADGSVTEADGSSNVFGTYALTVHGAAGATSGCTATVTPHYYVDAAHDLVGASAKFAVGGTTIASLTLTADSDSYTPGQKVTLTLTAKDKFGNPVADKKYGIWYDSVEFVSSATAASVSPLTYSAALTSDPFKISNSSAAAVQKAYTFSNGVKTASFFAPYTDGAVSLTSTLAAANTADAGGHYGSGLAAALQGTTLATTVNVVTGASAASQAAIDAAQEATDAANAAYDAANNAMDSADAATAAAQDASDNASAALAAVTALSATVAKLVASVNSIAAALAKIQKKLKA